MADEQTVQGTQDGSQQPTPTSGVQSSPQQGVQGTQQSSTPGTQGSGTPQTAKQFTYQEDRSNWIPKHRFDEVNTRAERVRELEAAINERDRKIQALAGVDPVDPKARKAEEIEEAFLNLPRVGSRIRKILDMPDEQFDKLLTTPQQIDQVAAAEQRGWVKFGNESVDYIATGIADALGIENLDGDQKKELRVLFSTWLKDKATKEWNDSGRSETVDRYENGDRKLFDEFTQAYTKRWVDPARRQSTARTINRSRPVPSSTGRGTVSVGAAPMKKPGDFKSLDEYLDATVNRAAVLGRERGVDFNR